MFMSNFLSLIMLQMIFSFFTPSIGKQKDYAEKVFIKQKSFMTEREALSKEINYYKPPYIYKKQHVEKLTGKDLISICNEIERENNERRKRYERGEAFSALEIRVSDIKEYALDHPNDIVANKFYFEGRFTNYSEDSKYSNIGAFVIVVPEVKLNDEYRYIIRTVFFQ